MNDPQAGGQLTIGDLAKRTGFRVSAIRYYEEVGLIPPAKRRPSGHRVYESGLQDVLTLIRHCRDFGFSIEDTRSLVSLASTEDRDCVEARDLAQVHLDVVRLRLAELRALERTLSKFVRACSDECAGGPAAQCTIFKDLRRADSKLAIAGASCCG